MPAADDLRRVLRRAGRRPRAVLRGLWVTVPIGMAVTNRAARYRRGSACPGLLRQQASR